MARATKPVFRVILRFARSLLYPAALLAAGSSAAAGPSTGAYMIHPAGAPRDCLVAGAGAHLRIDVGCAHRAEGQFMIVRNSTGRYTIRPSDRPSFCATVARGVVFGAPAIDVLACGGRVAPDDLCDAGDPDQTFDFIDGPNFLIYGIVGLGAQPFAAWDVGDYGPDREVKYWNPDTGRPPKQRFTLEPLLLRVGQANPALFRCAHTLGPHRGVPVPAPKPPLPHG